MPDSYAQEYLRSIQEARNSVLSPNGIPKAASEGLLRLYARMLSGINRDLGQEVITAERAEALQRQITARFNQLGNQTGVLLERGKVSAMQRAVEGHTAGVEAATSITGVSVEVSFNAVPQQALELMMLRRGLNAKNYKSVINRGLQSAAGDIEDYLHSAVGRGVSGRRGAQELAGILSRNNDRVLSLVQDSRLSKSNINAALREGDISVREYKQANKILFDSRRIMVTETNNAFREADLVCQDRSPVVGGSKWEVSSRHYGLPSSPDSCTYLHETDQFGMGEGVFPIRNVPGSQHPFCGCYTTSVIRDPDQWNSPARAAQQPPTLTESQANRYFDGKTDKYIERQREVINYYQDLAYRVATGAGTQAA